MTVVVDREALAHWFVGAGLVRGTGALATARARVEQLIDDDILLEAAAVRHEHGERIATEIEATTEGVSGPARIGAYLNAARIARDLSSPP